MVIKDEDKIFTTLNPTGTSLVKTSTADGVVRLRNSQQIIATVKSTVDDSLTVKLIGTLQNDASMSNPSTDTEIAVADGSGTTQVESIQSDAKWLYIDFTAKPDSGATTGDLDITLHVEEEHP